ncbi:hypothetical protein [Paraliomyxa miuraensis]|uniref:hypothetical protein n=1 Tax=Paraliomyxa miuraensis TaxID=376150 RepID=UPI00225917C4|nr:hypothetical protein [Paraliomyxa miuraensis]MCX4239587.1 hypothetical protein [Paraliomyxa miuraensis]
MDPDGSGETPAVCGNGVVEDGEVCDDGINDGAYDGCSPDCSELGPHCGDGFLDDAEACDDGDQVDGNGCNVDCVVSGSVLWEVTYDSLQHGVDTAYGITADSMDNVIVAGALGYGAQSVPWLRKYSPDGSPVWTANLTSPGSNASLGPIATLPDDGFVVGGSFDPGGPNDAWLMRVSSTGQTVWSQTHAGLQGGWDRIRGIGIDTEGFVYVLFEYGDPTTETGYQTVLRKQAPDGTEQWTQAQSGTERAMRMTVNAENRILLAGVSVAGGVEQAWLQLKDSNGADFWTENPNLAGETHPDALAMNGNGDIAIAVSPSGASPRITRLTPNGAETTVIFPLPTAPLFTIETVHLDDDGNVVAGGTNLVDDTTIEGWVSKYDADDSETWTNVHDGDFDTPLSWDVTLSIDVDTQGNILAAGAIHSEEASKRDIWLAKYAP